MTATKKIDPLVLAAATSLIRQSEWGMRGNVVELVRLLTVDSGYDVAQLSLRDVADWLRSDTRHTRRLLTALTERHRVLIREPGAGRRAASYRIEPDPTKWLHVPWRSRKGDADNDERGRAPELIRRRIADAALCGARGRHNEPLAARYSALQPAVVTALGAPLPNPLRAPQSAPLRNGLRAPQSAPQNGGRASSSEGGSAPDARQIEEVDLDLTGAAKAVAEAIVRLGVGPVKGRLRHKLAAGFAGVAVDQLGPILAALPGAALDGQRPPALVTMAVEMAGAGACRPAGAPIGAWRAELSEQEHHAEALRRDVAQAEAEGDEHVAGIFRRDLEACEDRIATLRRKAAG